MCFIQEMQNFFAQKMLVQFGEVSDAFITNSV